MQHAPDGDCRPRSILPRKRRACAEQSRPGSRLSKCPSNTHQPRVSASIMRRQSLGEEGMSGSSRSSDWMILMMSVCRESGDHSIMPTFIPTHMNVMVCFKVIQGPQKLYLANILRHQPYFRADQGWHWGVKDTKQPLEASKSMLKLAMSSWSRQVYPIDP